MIKVFLGLLELLNAAAAQTGGEFISLLLNCVLLSWASEEVVYFNQVLTE
jgi:hypothetical protein